MKKFLIFAVIVAALFTVDHPSIKEPRDEIFEKVMSHLSTSSKVNREVKATNVREQIEAALELSVAQKTHLADLTTTNSTMRRWYASYCEQNELNEYFYGDDLRQLCSAIKSTEG